MRGGGPIARRIVAVLGGIAGFYVAGYTGVLLAVTNRPIWSDTPLLGMLFVVSAASTSAALLILVAGRQAWSTPGIAALHRMDDWVLLLELVLIVLFVFSLGEVARVWLSWRGLALALLVVLLGILLPLVLHFRPLWVLTVEHLGDPPGAGIAIGDTLTKGLRQEGL